ncbi:hypothetical protein ACVWY2_005864 [Bradyrhizobium sp. JR6.1]
MRTPGGDAFGDAGDLRHEHDGQRHDRIGDAGAERARDRDREQHRRKCVEHIDGAHDRGVELAADVTGDEAERGSYHKGEDHRQDADDQRQPSAVDQPRQHVAAEFVGAERIARRAYVAETTDHRALIGIGEMQPWRQQRGGKDQHQDDGTGHADLVAPDAAPNCRPVAARLGRGGGLQCSI